MKLVINQTKKESFLFDNERIATLKMAYSFIRNAKETWNFEDDKIKIHEYSKINSFVDKIIKRKRLTF